jgi:hypothetical protein
MAFEASERAELATQARSVSRSGECARACLRRRDAALVAAVVAPTTRAPPAVSEMPSPRAAAPSWPFTTLLYFAKSQLA